VLVELLSVGGTSKCWWNFQVLVKLPSVGETSKVWWNFHELMELPRVGSLDYLLQEVEVDSGIF